MSHFVERKQNDCLNCGAVVCGRYCHLCGQENIEPKESFWHLVTHFVYDITHFDGKFFSTVKYLLFKPGFLSQEYIAGRRMRYLNPIKMYVFVSAFFFLFFFSIVHPSFETEEKQKEPTYAETKYQIQEEINDLRVDLKDSDISQIAKVLAENKLQALQQDSLTLLRDTSHLKQLNYFKIKDAIRFGQYQSLTAYDSAQNYLPANQKDGWLKNKFIRKGISLQEKYGDDSKSFFKILFEKFRHSFPQLLFVSLPLFALLLRLLYIRQKRFYYVDHVIYAVHLYCAMFILLFIILAFTQIEHFQYLHWLDVLTVPLTLYIIWYQYKSLRNFYEQGRLKTFLKYLLLLIMSSVIMLLLFIAFLVLSVFNL